MNGQSKRNRRRIGIAPLLLATLFYIGNSVSAYAETRACSTKIGSVGHDLEGAVWIGTGLGWWRVCNTTSAMQVFSLPGSAGPSSIPVGSCEALLAQFMTARETQRNVIFFMDFGAAAAPACAPGMLGQWVTPNPYPYYIEFTSTQ